MPVGSCHGPHAATVCPPCTMLASHGLGAPLSLGLNLSLGHGCVVTLSVLSFYCVDTHLYVFMIFSCGASPNLFVIWRHVLLLVRIISLASYPFYSLVGLISFFLFAFSLIVYFVVSLSPLASLRFPLWKYFEMFNHFPSVTVLFFRIMFSLHSHRVKTI